MIIPILLGCATGAATLTGGIIALRLRERNTLMLALTAGILLGISLFDLGPEAVTLSHGVWSGRSLAVWMAAGFAFYMLLTRSALFLKPTAWRIDPAPAMLAAHSLLDGVGIGLAYQVDTSTGWIVALAVLAHDIADGVNIVTLGLLTGTARSARMWLGLDCVAPILGVLLGLSVTLTPTAFAPILGAAAGCFLYLGASEMLPRVRDTDPRCGLALATLVGMTIIGLTTR